MVRYSEGGHCGDPSCCLPVDQVSSGALQQLKENLALAKAKRPLELGVDGVVPPDPVAIEKIRHKFLTMRKVYSPEKKVSLLLRVCKLIYTIMQDNSGTQEAPRIKQDTSGSTQPRAHSQSTQPRAHSPEPRAHSPEPTAVMQQVAVLILQQIASSIALSPSQ